MRLTTLSHGGGCGCKIAPHVLEEILKKLPYRPAGSSDLLVGFETSDDAAVYKINEDQALVFTTDFFMPVVDDAFDFGRIAATNAISDVYAMGGTPIMALSILGMPIGKIPTDVIGKILEGGQLACSDAGIAIVGGHSIDTLEPIFGLAVVGLTHPNRLLKNSSPKVGDLLVLTKALGVGLYTTCLKKELLSSEDYTQVLSSMTSLNKVGSELSQAIYEVHSATDVTGFGLLGHLNEMCRASGLGAKLFFKSIPTFKGIEKYLKPENFPGGAKRNLAGYGHDVKFCASLSEAEQLLLADPQTSGGLLLSVAPNSVETVLAVCRSFGNKETAVVGEVVGRSDRNICVLNE